MYFSVTLYLNEFILFVYFFSDSDILVMKYDSSSSATLWTRLTGSDGLDSGRAVAVSADGQSVYVTGEVSSGEGQIKDEDIVLMKYDAGAI